MGFPGVVHLNPVVIQINGFFKFVDMEIGLLGGHDRKIVKPIPIFQGLIPGNAVIDKIHVSGEPSVVIVVGKNDNIVRPFSNSR